MIATILGVAGPIFGLIAAYLWWRASRVSWSVGREDRSVGDFSFHPGAYAGPNELDPYLREVGQRNTIAAMLTAVSMICWTAQTIASALGI